MTNLMLNAHLKIKFVYIIKNLIWKKDILNNVIASIFILFLFILYKMLLILEAIHDYNLLGGDKYDYLDRVDENLIKSQKQKGVTKSVC